MEECSEEVNISYSDDKRTRHAALKRKLAIRLICLSDIKSPDTMKEFFQLSSSQKSLSKPIDN